jgi:photosystem II stability/assembly factor-like uncharacterized protein
MKIYTIIFALFISLSGFSQLSEKKILFKGDSLWYASTGNILFSSVNKGKNWDTAFAKTNRADTIFFYSDFDTTKNIFIADQKTIFIFGWDGTMHFKTILYSSSDCGKSWSKNKFVAENGVVGVSYFHKISPNRFFLDCRYGAYLISDDCGKTWYQNRLTNEKSGCRDERFIFNSNGYISLGFYTDKKCLEKVIVTSPDGGLTWIKEIRD